MKNKLYLIFAFIITFVGYSQQVIGTYPVHDGGFEGHTATSLVGGTASAAALSTSLWTANTGTNVVRVINSTGGRSGFARFNKWYSKKFLFPATSWGIRTKH